MDMFRSKFFQWSAVFLLTAVLAESPAAAWDADGHELMAAMAYSQLNPKAKKAVADLAREIQTPGQPYDAVTIACWMDDLKKNDPAMAYHGLFYSWHYIDIGLEPDDPPPSWEPGDDNEMQGNVVKALKRAWVVLRGGADPYIKTKAMACAMAMHLVGDIHQPLHAATRYFRTSDGFLHDDAGGNREGVLNGPPEAGGKFNLHAFWDSAWRASFDDATGYVVLDARYQEQSVHDPQLVQPLAKVLSHQGPPPGADLKTNIDSWARESNQLARDFVYRETTASQSPKYCRFSSGYVAKANLLARRQLVLAADRLAVLLNDTLGDDVSSTPPPSYPAGPKAP